MAPVGRAFSGPTAQARQAAHARRHRRRRRRSRRRRSRAFDRGRGVAAGHQHGGGLPRRAAHGDAVARARLLRPRHRGAGISGLGLPAIRPRLAARRRGGATHDGAGAACPRQGPRQARGAADDSECDPAARAAARDCGEAIAVGGARQRAADGRHHPVARAQRLQPRLDRARSRRLCGARRHHRSLRARHGRSGAARFLRRPARDDPQFRSG